MLQNWPSMRTGFEEDSGNTYWFGAEKAYKLFLGKQLAVRIELWDDKSEFLTAEFDFLGFGDASENFKMSLGKLMKGSAGDGKMELFSAPMAALDKDITNMSCINDFASAWWYRSETFASTDGCVTSILVPNSKVGLRWMTATRNHIVKVVMKARYAFLSHGKCLSIKHTLF